MSKILVLVAVMVLLVGIAAFGEKPAQPSQPQIRSIELPKSDAGPQKPSIEANKDYWRCVLEHLQGTQSDDAVPIILAACRELNSP